MMSLESKIKCNTMLYLRAEVEITPKCSAAKENRFARSDLSTRADERFDGKHDKQKANHGH